MEALVTRIDPFDRIRMEAEEAAIERSEKVDEMVELADELEAIRNSVDAFNPDARMAAHSAFDAAERVWKLTPRIIESLRAQATSRGG